MLEIGSVIDGKYKILNKVGQGGMSVVYLAMNEKANKQWAIKEVRKDGTQEFDVVKQGLIAETDILKRLNHPNLPSIIDVIDNEDSFFIVMDYIEGNPLSKAINERGAQPQELVIEWGKQLCDVLGYLHTREHPIIYRDMKPSNVMLKPDGNVSLIDFGTAREFKEASVEDTTCLGTRGYAAPEQYGGLGQTDARTDIYCLGSTLYHLVTGHNPSAPPYEMYPIRQWNPSLSAGLEEIILKCTRQNPSERYQSCAELMYALDHYDELDIVYRTKQKKKLAAFITCLVFTLLFGAASLICHFQANAVRASSYSGYIEQAQKADGDDKIDYYRQAIGIAPDNEESYLSVLDVLLGDDEFSNEDDEIVRTILKQRGYDEQNSSTNEEMLKTNADGYALFSYNYGLAYYFYSSNDTEKSKAYVWFQNAALEDPVRKKKAEILSYISENCLKKSKLNRAGDDPFPYGEYWNNLCSLYKYMSDTSTEDYDQFTYLVLSEEICSMVSANYGNMHSLGKIEYANMKQELTEIETMLTVTEFSADMDSRKQSLSQKLGVAMSAVDNALASQT